MTENGNLGDHVMAILTGPDAQRIASARREAAEWDRLAARGKLVNELQALKCSPITALPKLRAQAAALERERGAPASFERAKEERVSADAELTAASMRINRKVEALEFQLREAADPRIAAFAAEVMQAIERERWLLAETSEEPSGFSTW